MPHGVVGTVVALATAIVGCTPFGTDDASPPASLPDDAGVPNDDGGATDAGTSLACGPFVCPNGALFCETFDTIASPWFTQLTHGTVREVEDCTGKALLAQLPAASGAGPRTARVILNRQSPGQTEFVLEFDAWIDTGDFESPSFGTILGLSAHGNGNVTGFVGLSFGENGLNAVIRSVPQERSAVAPIPLRTWVHVGFHAKFDATNGLVEVAFDGKTVAVLFGPTLSGPLNGLSLELGALTDGGPTPALTVKIDNLVLR